ncbi:MAG: hypothetical protein CBB68_09030 [Rhodospirillaceae bacterium TMED8]|mgnify:CR=1 FL=1|nr:thioesterase [Magnetovibrio sp.]OUT50503.1 MAG: hypothetical protein CBB68_09030 [Rhodospirillaceae bacterium TMED8]|tara:strand:+ start:1088 stop:1555 length:468 start_codon:yes stop_codon:yes gene_type:complete
MNATSADILPLSKVINILRDEDRLTDINGLVPYADFLGVVSAFEGGELVSRLPFREDMIGNYTTRIFHGGVLGALMEQAAYVHLLHDLKRLRLPKVINISINYLRPVVPEDVLAGCITVRQGARIANVRVRSWQTSWNEPVGTADVHFLLPKIRK